MIHIKLGTEKIRFRFFKGWLDEIHIFAADPEQEEIQMLVGANSIDPQT